MPWEINIYILDYLSSWRPRFIEFKFLSPECLADHILNTSVKQFSTALRKKCGPQFLHFIFWVSLADKVVLYEQVVELLFSSSRVKSVDTEKRKTTTQKRCYIL